MGGKKIHSELSKPLIGSARDRSSKSRTSSQGSVDSDLIAQVPKMRVLHAAYFRDTHYKWQLLARRGYSRLIHFLIFACFFLTAVQYQHNSHEVSDNVTAWRQAITQLKPDLVIKNSNSYFNFVTTKLIPLFFADQWTQIRYLKNDKEVALRGSKALQYQYLIGGIALTAKRTNTKECYRGTDCREDTFVHEPYLYLHGANGTSFEIPYNEFYHGYTVYIPTTDKSTAMELINLYKAAQFFDHTVSMINLNWITFNPNNKKTISLLEFGAHVSASGTWNITFEMDALPYHLYPEFRKDPYALIARLAIEFLSLVFIIRLIIPLVKLQFSEEIIGTDKRLLGMPADRTGSPYQKVAILMWILVITDILLWILLLVLASNLPNFGAPEIDTLYEVPKFLDLASREYQKLLFSNFYDHVLPFYMQCTTFSNVWNVFSVFNGATVLVMTFRFFEYVSFQKRLSMITDTFAGIASELIHLLIVFTLVCFSFALICVFTFGNLDPTFSAPSTAVAALFALCFGMYRPAVTQSPGSVGLYKYAPHTTNPAYQAFIFPEVIVIAFKLLVFMMLFKFIIAMIMDSYKDNHKKHRVRSRSISQEVKDLLNFEFRRFASRFTSKVAFVEMQDIAKALYHHEQECYQLTCANSDQSDRNSVGTRAYLSLEMSQLYRHRKLGEVISKCKDVEREYSKDDITWALETYGVTWSLGLLKEKKRRQMLALEEQKDDVHFKETRLVFEKFDRLKVGFIEIADLDNALILLNFNEIASDASIMHKLIEKYDCNEDGVLEFQEFQSLMSDQVFTLDQKAMMHHPMHRARVSTNLDSINLP